MATVAYRVEVDWDNNGVWEAVDEQPVLNRGVGIQGGREAARLFAPVRNGTADWTADNSDLRFNDTSGSIGGDLKLNRRCRIVADDGTTETVLFTGYLEKWKVKAEDWPLIVADFSAFDVLARLATITLSTAIYTNKRTDELVQTVLDEAGLSTITVSADTGLTTLAYWWSEGESALDALNRLALLEQGQVYLTADGAILFQDRYNRLDNTTDAATLTESQHVKSIEWLTDPTNVINRVTITCPVYSSGSVAAVWQQTDAITLAPNESRVFVVSGSDPFVSAITPVAGTDYTLSAGGVTPSLSRTSGKTTRLTMTAGSGGCTFSGLQVRATALEAEETTWFFEDTTSQDDYGIRDYATTFGGLPTAEVGRDAAQYLLQRYAQPLPAVAVTLKAGTGDSADSVLAAILGVTYGDRVSLDLPYAGIDWSGFVDGIKHLVYAEWHEVTFIVEQMPTADVLTLDDDVYGLLDNNRLGW